MTENQIKNICDRYNINNWSINSETGLVDVDGSVNLSWKNLTELPLNFGDVKGSFLCNTNKLTTLKGAPFFVGGDFYCSSNKLTTLKGLPKHIGVDFYYDCNKNLSIWEHRWILYTEIGGDIYTDNEKLDNFLNKNKNPPKSELPKLFAELKRFVG